MSDTIHFDGMPHLSVAEAAARAGLSVSYIRGLLRRGEMKSRGAGEKKYVDERSLNTFLVEREYKREMKRRELSRKRTEEYTQRLSVMDPSPPAREVRSTRINERPVMDWGSLRASLLERTIALTLAIMMTIGTYAFVDQQSARHNLGLMQEGLQDVVDTLASVAETSKMITMDPSRSLAAAASFIPESLANFAKAFNTQINSLVYGAAFPENVPDSGASAAVEIQPYARATSQQPTPDDQQLPLATSASTSTTIINNPVIERVVERTIERVVETRTVASAGGLTEEYLADKLGQLDNKLSSKMFALSSANSTAITQTYSVVSQSNKIDQLTNTDITGPRISGGTLTNAEISGGTISGASISGGAVSATTLSAGETTISDDLTLAGSLFFTTSSSTISATLASSTDALFTNATSTYLFATAATSTSFFATVASSTNLYSQSASLGSLALSGLGIFSSGFLSLASTTIGNGSEDGGLTVFGGATTTGNAYFAGGLGIGVSTTTAGAFQTSGNAHIGGNLLVAGDSTVLGASAADTLSIQSSITSDIVPNQNITYDLGSASFFWENIYVGTVVANNLSAASSTIAGTSAATFTINSDNVSSDAEDADLIFFRGNVVPNALISWKSATQRFELNQASYISNLSGSTTQPTLRLQGVAGQTGNLFEIASSTGTTMFSVDATGATLGNGFLSQASSTVVGDFTATGNATFGGTFSTGTTSLSNLSVTNTSTSTFAGGVSLATLAASGAATLGSTLSVAGDTTLASATSTTFFATTASSTNLFAQSTSFGALALPGFAQNRVPYFGAAGAITSGPGLTYDGTTLTAGNLTSSGAVSLGFATSTSLFATTASSTNLFAQTASLGALSVLGTTVHSGATTLSSALTYGGVTLANAVTGTGSMVLSSSPTLTGTMLAAAATLSSTLTMGGSAANIALGTNWLSGDGDDEGITINSSGEVGVGVAPEAGKQLTVTGDARFNGSVFLNGAAGVDPIFWMDQFAGPTTVVINTDGDSYLTGGRLGIGIDTPAARLTVKGEGTTTGINFQTTNSADAPLFTILDNGNVGIGTTSPSALFSVAGSGYFTGSIRQGTNSNLTVPGVGSILAYNPAGSGSSGIWAIGNSGGQGSVGAYDQTPGHVGAYLFSADAYAGIATIDNAGAFTGNPINFTASSVGIGTTTPASKLSIVSANPAAPYSGVGLFSDSATAYTAYTVGRTGVDGYFGVAGGTNQYIAGAAQGDMILLASSGKMLLGTGPAASPGALGLTISSGNVGIGTTDPQAKLAVGSPGNANSAIFGNGGGSTNDGVYGYITGTGRAIIGDSSGSGGTGVAGYSGSGNGGYFTSNSGPALVTGTGNVGIGMTPSTHRLEISPGALGATSGNTANALKLYSATGNTDTFEALWTRTASSPTNWTTAEFVLRRNVDTTAAQGAITFTGDGGMRLSGGAYTNNHIVLTGGGNVGIGTSPSYKLQISGDASGTSNILQYFNNSGGTSARLAYQDTATTFAPNMGSVGDHITFDTMGSEKLRITSAGNVGIGNSGPSYKLDVTGEARVTSNLYAGNTLRLNGTDTSNTIWQSTSNATLAITTNGGLLSLGAAISAQTLNITSSGNVGIGTTNPSDAMLYVSGSTNGGIVQRLGNSNSGSSAYTVFAINNDTASNLNLFLNSSTRSSDGGTNTATLRNDGGALRLLSSGSGGLTIAASTGDVSASAGVTAAGAFTTTNTGNPGVWFNAAAGTYRFTRYSTAGSTRWDVGTTDYAESGANAGSDFYFSRWADNGSNLGLAMVIQRSSGNIGIDTNNPDQGKIEVKGGTVCVDTNSDNNATSCIASESDARLKTNITSISASSSLDTILALNPVSFDWRASDPEVLAHYPLISRYASSTHSIGLIAQEVMPVLPEALSMETVGDAEVQYFQLDYTKVIPHLIGAVKEIYAQVTEIASKIAQLLQSDNQQNDKIAALEGRIEQLEALVAGAAGSGGGAGGSPGSSPESGDTATSTPDTTPPVITLSGADPALIEIGSVYSDRGAIVTDDVDQNLGYTVSLNGATSTDPSALVLDTSTSTTHIITYSATDQAGNEGQTTRTVIVGE